MVSIREKVFLNPAQMNHSWQLDLFQMSQNNIRPEFASSSSCHFFSLAGQLTANEKLCVFVVTGDEFARNRPSGPTS